MNLALLKGVLMVINSRRELAVFTALSQHSGSVNLLTSITEIPTSVLLRNKMSVLWGEMKHAEVVTISHNAQTIMAVWPKSVGALRL